MIPSNDSQVGPLIEVFELYMMRDMLLTDVREPATVAAHAMLECQLSPELILTMLDGAIRIAELESGGHAVAVQADELRGKIGEWLMDAMFDPNSVSDRTLLVA